MGVEPGLIVIGLGTACPDGYVRVAALDGKMLRAGPAYVPAAGGADTHGHAASLGHTHSFSGGNTSSSSSSVGVATSSGITVSGVTHSHSWSGGSTATKDLELEAVPHVPPYAAVLLCQKL